MSGAVRDTERWFRPAGTLSASGWDVVVDGSIDGWKHTGLYVAQLADSAVRTIDESAFDDGDAEFGWEHVVVPLSGSVSVTCVDRDGVKHDAVLDGRPSVFAGATDVAYLPPGSESTLTALGPARVAVAVARTDADAPAPGFRHVAADEVPVEMRGAGAASREVRNFGVPGVLDAVKVIACEVVTPAGNWSSFPPHKHDEERPGQETELEEIYYYEVQVAVGADPTGSTDPVGYQRVYGTTDRPIEVFAEVRTGDVVLIPHGWHGPSMATPGYDLYYLNVMAGPGPERAWRICDDPAHGWVRQTWHDQPIDPRLPMGGAHR